jgi:hypothetical protein
MQWLDIAPRSHPFRSAALCLVVKGAASSGKLPSSLFVHGVKLESRDPFFGGGFADVYRGVCEGEMVAVKKPRALSMVSNPYAVSRKHDNVLPWLTEYGSGCVVKRSFGINFVIPLSCLSLASTRTTSRRPTWLGSSLPGSHPAPLRML